jgi:hypothetical protein
MSMTGIVVTRRFLERPIQMLASEQEAGHVRRTLSLDRDT